MKKNKSYFSKSYSQFESEVKFAKPIRIVGMLLFFVLMLSWIDLIRINLHPYFSLLVLAVLMTYFFMGVNYYRKKMRE